MKICPKCGNIIPDWAAGVCYVCARIEKEEKRFGRRGRGNRLWLHLTPPMPQPTKTRYPAPHTPAERTLARLKGINRLLETIYGKPHFISDILRAKGFEEEEIQLIKRHHLEDYLDKFVDGLHEVFDNPKWDRLLETIRYRYGLAEREKMTLRAIGAIYGLSGERIRQLQNKAIRIMRNSKRKGKLENMAVNVAREVLGRERRA